MKRKVRLMYENETFEVILNRMLERVPDSFDKREGSIIYDALAPIAAEMAQGYAAMKDTLELSMARTSNGVYLDMRLEESGVNRHEATKAIRKGVFNMPVPQGSRFRGGSVVYVVKEAIEGEENEYRLEAEAAGVAGNQYFGPLLPLQNIDGLTSAVLDDVLVLGQDQEEDPSYFSRYLEEVNAHSYGGNIDQYKEWLREIPGVGRYKVVPLWDGRGTVKAIITDANNSVPSGELVEIVQTTIDPYQDGEGRGLAPIGHIFTAEGAMEKIINLDVEAEFNEGFGPDDVKGEIEDIMNDYFSMINFATEEPTVLRNIIVASMIVELNQIKDIVSLSINGSTANIVLDDEEIAVLGTVTVYVSD